MANYQCSKSLADKIKLRELGLISQSKVLYHPSITQRIDRQSQDIYTLVQRISNATKEDNWSKIECIVNDIMTSLTEVLDFGNGKHNSPEKKSQRDYFVLFGGVQALLSIFSMPSVNANDDARRIRPFVMRRNETWNEIMVILRDLIISIPSIADQYIDNRCISTLVTFLYYKNIFDNVMNLLEEILATREETFPLSIVPNFYQLVEKFTARQLAHFCRVLSLVVFEPEDRQTLESPQALRSMEVLRLRRKRMLKGNNVIVERNQNLVLEMPNFLSHMVQILKVINYGPSLSDTLNHNVTTHVPISNDIMVFNSTAMNISDWDHFQSLIATVSSHSLNARSTNNQSHHVNEDENLEDEINMDLLAAFSIGSALDGSGSSRHVEISSIINVMRAAQNLGIARLTALGQALIQAQPFLEAQRNGGQLSPSAVVQPFVTRLLQSGISNARRARNELQFHAMLLNPHQIELIFVLCTLLAGRRKLAVQKKLYEEGLSDVLLKMFDRMSWEAPPYSGVNPMEHIHGPSCECNPESAIRVQYLRLVHNFYDRDLLGNINMYSVLSPSEQVFVTSSLHQTVADGFMNSIGASSTSTNAMIARAPSAPVSSAVEGLLSKILCVLMKETNKESSYRFWLSACIENFLRGCGHMGQLLVVRSGCMQHVVQFIINSSLTNTGSPGKHGNNVLQTAFDLLCEMVKGNPISMGFMEEQISDEDFHHLITIVVNNMIDSNVFLRALFMNMEIVSRSEQITSVHQSNLSSNQEETKESHQTDENCKTVYDAFNSFRFLDNALDGSEVLTLSPRPNYLTDSWIMFSPKIVSQTAAKIVENPTEYFASYPRKHYNNRNNHTGKSGRSALTSNVVGAWKDIRKAATHFFRFGEPSPSSVDSNNSNQEKSCFFPKETNEMEDARYYTPPEGPYFARQSTNTTTSTVSQNSSPSPSFSVAALREHVEMKGDDAIPSTTCSPSLSFKSPASESAKHNTTLKSNFFRFSMFLLQEKISIIVKLMGVVTLRTISHENICCINTLLLILLLDNSRGLLAQTLSRARKLADEVMDPSGGHSILAKKTPSKFFHNLGSAEEKNQCFGPNCGTTSLLCSCDSNVALCDECSPPTTDQNNTSEVEKGSEIVFRNFREVLWYWQEFYLRRGRDRLSIEFSCRIPFSYWQEVVAKLCADDGSSTALLKRAIPLPTSPYSMNSPAYREISPVRLE
eukprot:gene5567-6129_t